jgi:hypothetical protein
MARYKLTDATFINSVHTAGAEVEYAGWPGSTMVPIDDEARETKEYYDETRKSRREVPNTPAEWRAKVSAEAAKKAPAVVVTDDPVPIPEDWREHRPEQIINLARKLGAPVKGTNTERATAFIEAQIKLRAESAAAETETGVVE